MRTLAIIPARGGSKGLPGKNIAPLAGKPLVAWTLLAAQKSNELSRVVVSTDAEEIAEVVRAWGGDVPFLRPKELATDASRVVDSVEYTLRRLAEENSQVYDAVLLLQPTSPLRTSADIDGAIALSRSTGAPAIVGVCDAVPHPWLACGLDAGGALHSFFADAEKSTHRQDYPPAYVINGALYLPTCESLRITRSFQPPGTLGYVMPTERSVDIDHSRDLLLAEVYLRHGHS